MSSEKIIRKIIKTAEEYSAIAEEYLNKNELLEAQANLKISSILLDLAKEINDEEMNNATEYYS